MKKDVCTGLLSFAISLTISFGAAAGEAPVLYSNPANSRLEFNAFYESESLPGTFRNFSVEARRDPSSGAPGFLKVTVNTASADMNDRDINDELKQTDWFDTSRYPGAVFEAGDIRRGGQMDFVASGRLLLKGIATDLEVPFYWEETADGAELRGAVSLSRRAWNIGMGEWEKDETIGDEVSLRFKVELRPAGE